MRFLIATDNLDDLARLHLRGFKHFLPDEWNGQMFDGTVVRLPLRTEESELANRKVDPEEIRTLFNDFVQHEIDVSMLFLQHLRSINLIVISPHGHLEEIASCAVDVADLPHNGVTKKIVHTRGTGLTPRAQEWLVQSLHFEQQEALEHLRLRVPGLQEKVIKKHKLRPDVGIAFPLGVQTSVHGHLFTFLQLPLQTAFPVHVHAYFALLPSRAALRWQAEKGVVKGSEDQYVASIILDPCLLIHIVSVLNEWNWVLFDRFIPKAWANLLSVLTHDFHENIFSAWPPLQTVKAFGQSNYWATISRSVLNVVLDQRLAIWPAMYSQTYFDLEHILLVSSDTNESVLRSLSNVGLRLCVPPTHIFALVAAQGNWQHRILTPETAYQALQVCYDSSRKSASDELNV